MTLFFAFSKASEAVEQVCITVTIVCPLGGGSNCLICGDSPQSIQDAVLEMTNVVCGN